MLSKSQLYKGIFFFQNTNAIMCDWKKKKKTKNLKTKTNENQRLTLKPNKKNPTQKKPQTSLYLPKKHNPNQTQNIYS